MPASQSGEGSGAFLSRARAWTQPLWTAGFIGFISLLSIGAAFFLIQNGRSQVLLLALAVGGVLFWTDFLAGRHGPPTPHPGNHGLLPPGVVVALVALVIYFPTVNSYFVADDFGYVQLYSAPSGSRFFDLLRMDQSQGIWGYNAEEFRPLGGLSYMVNYWLSGTDPTSYHVVAVLQHALSALAVFLIASRGAGLKPWGSAFAGLLFALLPIHSEAVAWINGSKVDGLPTMFYLGSFAGFVYFRATGRARYLVLSMVAFAGSLLSKEIATTLPLLLLLYDLFGRLSPIDGRPDASSGTKRQGWLAFLLRHGPFWAILGVYLVVRGAIFHSYLREGQWGIHPRDMLASGHSFRVQITGLAKTFVQLQEFALDQALLHFSAIPVALVLGIVLAWSLLLLRTGSSGRREMTAVLFFGLVWYGVTSLPLLITYHSARHFYLPAAGPCLAIACLGARAGGESFGRTSSVRWAAALALLGALAFLTWGQNRQWVRAGELSKQLEGEFAVAVENTPGDSLAIVWAPDSYRDAYVWAWILPFALQPPFTSSDLYSQRPLIEFPDMFCCPVSQWWAKKRPVLLSALVGDPDGEIQVQRLAWDDPNQRVRRQGHAMTRKSLRAAVESVLGKSVEDAQDIDYDAAQKLMRRFVELTEQ